MTTLDKLKKSVVPSLFAGGVSVGLTYLLYDKNLMMPVPFGPLEVPAFVAIGGSCTIGNMAGEVLTEFVLPMIPKNESFQKYEEAIIPPVLAGASTYLAMKFLISDNANFQNSFVIGAGGSVVGSRIYGMM